MKNSKIKSLALVSLVGGTVLAGGCLGFGSWRQILWGGAISLATDFLTDNDGIFDLAEDGGTAAAPDTVN